MICIHIIQAPSPDSQVHNYFFPLQITNITRSPTHFIKRQKHQTVVYNGSEERTNITTSSVLVTKEEFGQCLLFGRPPDLLYPAGPMFSLSFWDGGHTTSRYLWSLLAQWHSAQNLKAEDIPGYVCHFLQ